MPTYEAITSTNISAGTSSVSITGFSGYFALRVIINGASNNDFRIRFNNDTTSSRYSQYWTRYNAGSGVNATYYNSTFSAIFLGDVASQDNQNYLAIIDIYNYTSTSASPPRAKQGFLRIGTREPTSTFANTYYGGFSFYDTDNPISSLQILTAGTFSNTTTVALYGIG